METPKKIAFRFDRDDDYRVIPANGVWGGPTPRGDIKVDFFYESQPLPEEFTQEVTSGGKLRARRKGQPTFQRTVMVGIVLTAEQAESIGRWLQEKARELSERTEEKGGADDERDTPITTH